MKTYTFFLSGRALAVVVVGLMGIGAVTFVLGLLVGVALQPVTVSGRVSASSQPHVVADVRPDVVYAPPESGTAQWPFTGVGAAPTTDSATPALPAPPRDTVKRDSTRRPDAIIGVSYNPAANTADATDLAAIPAPDTARYVVQVGAFRIEDNARSMVALLQSAGYRATISVRMDEGRPLHVVRVGRFIGYAAAEQVAAEIGVSEQIAARLVATVLVSSRR
jgi:cell division septation protein DedD